VELGDRSLGHVWEGLVPVLYKMSQWACNRGPEQKGIRTHASKVLRPLTQGKIFALKDPFVDILYCTYCINTVYIFFLCRLKIN
jgi:hypothetical protein